MSSDGFDSHLFTKPPPIYNSNWRYNQPPPHTVDNKGSQINKSAVAPPLPLGPPPPPPPLPQNNKQSYSVPPARAVPSSSNIEQRSQSLFKHPQDFGPRRYPSLPFLPVPSGQYSIGQYNNTPERYNSLPGHFNAVPSGQYNTSQSQLKYNNSPNYPWPYYQKRKIDPDAEILKKSNKKKKKPLSKNIPQRKDWSVLDASKALSIEKEYNKKNRSQSLIIKFPDLELNRDIVSKFHTAIESVHFQQPSTPRFCFVTLKDSINPESVIQDLNKIPFGEGYLSAEFKKDREDDLNIGPEDIDPLTLYVGNLAQEVTKEDMVTTYPKQKRIDIGYAKKMKYTRYAFVSFKNVEDSIDAFKATHAKQMYSKSLIVRFRRLNGTVGMPGEPKTQIPQRNETAENCSNPHVNSNYPNGVNRNEINNDMSEAESDQLYYGVVDVSQWECPMDDVFQRPCKQEPIDESDFDDEGTRCQIPLDNSFSHLQGDSETNQEEDSKKHILPSALDLENKNIPSVIKDLIPKPMTETEVKQETRITEYENLNPLVIIKNEPVDFDEQLVEGGTHDASDGDLNFHSLMRSVELRQEERKKLKVFMP